MFSVDSAEEDGSDADDNVIIHRPAIGNRDTVTAGVSAMLDYATSNQAQCCAVLRCINRAMLCYCVLCCAVLCCAVLCCAVL